MINIDLHKIFVIDFSPCTDPQKWCQDWKLEMNNHNISLVLSILEEPIAWLIAILGGSRSEQKIVRLQMERIPQTDFFGGIFSKDAFFRRPMWSASNHEVVESCFAKQPQRDDVR